MAQQATTAAVLTAIGCPDAAWGEMERAECDRDRATMAVCADWLVGWLERDGHLPRPLFQAGRKAGLAMMRLVRSVAEMP